MSGRPNGADADLWAGTPLATASTPHKVDAVAIRSLRRDAVGLARQAVALRREAIEFTPEAATKAATMADRLEAQADRIWSKVDALFDEPAE